MEDCEGNREGRLPTHLLIAERAVELLKAKDNGELYRETYFTHLVHSNHLERLASDYKYDVLKGMAHSCYGCALIKGARDEDDRGRAFNHFYNGEDRGQGLPWHDYYDNPQFSARKPERGHFYSALEWAQGGESMVVNAERVNESAYPRNWLGALEAYGYSPEEKLLAYGRLGHVLHLLGDMAQPDHAKLEPHPGSGCPFGVRVAVALYDAALGAGAGALVGAGAGAVYGAATGGDAGKSALIGAGVGAAVGAGAGLLAGTVEGSRTTGYERLINDEWETLDSATELPAVITDAQPLKLGSLSEYFDDMATKSRNDADRNRFENPLGLEKINSTVVFAGMVATGAAVGAGVGAGVGALAGDAGKGALVGAGAGVAVGAAAGLIAGGVPTGEDIALKPIITDGMKRGYLELADRLIPRSVELCAGILKFFYDIVRPPPYVKSIRAFQELSDGTLEYSGEVEDNATDVSVPASWSYNSKNRPSGDVESGSLRKVTGRTIRQVTPDTPFSTARPIEVRIEFGPEATRIDGDSVRVSIGGVEVTGRMVDATHWEGRLGADQLSGADIEDEVPVEIYAEDVLPHYQGNSVSPRTEQGSKLDTDPTTPAKISPFVPHDWQGYESGESGDWVDRNHRIRIAQAGRITVETVSKM